MMKAEETFCKLVETLTYKGIQSRSVQLTNITFFLGNILGSGPYSWTFAYSN
jgi:hypothetical protein